MTRSVRDIAATLDPDERHRPYCLRGTVEATADGFMDSTESGLLAMHRWHTDENPRSLRDAVDRHVHGTAHRFLFYNTWLLEYLDVDIGDDPEERAPEIGRAIDGEYDVAALCEVFDAAELEVLRDNLPGYDDATGPPGNWVQKSAGLVTFCREEDDRRIGGQRKYVYEFEGDALEDLDTFSRKGVLLTRIEVEGGGLDVYSTHLLSGDDLGVHEFEDWLDDVFTGRDTDEISTINRYRLYQVMELLDFVDRTHDPANVAVVVGDFNISAHTPAYDLLVELMGEHDLVDLWPVRGGPVGRTKFIEEEEDTLGTICWFDPDEPGPHYCDDYTGKSAARPHDHDGRKEYDRIDYVFVETPQSAHGCALDASRIRRVPFWRGPGHPPKKHLSDVPHYLSDHLGLDVTFITSPR